MPEFNCNYCGAGLRIDTAIPGQTVRCGHCGQPTVIPGGPDPSPEHGLPPRYAPPINPAYLGQPPSQTNGFAIASLVCGIFGFCCLPVSIAAVVLGILALKQPTARGMAIAGLILGGIGLLSATMLIIGIITP